MPAAIESTGVLDRPRTAVPSDALTVAAIAALAYAAANVLHEGGGHGGACVLAGGTPLMLTSVSFDCSVDGLGTAAARFVASGGTIVNLCAGGIAAWAFGRYRTAGPATRFF